ncbi:hypothetical protein ACFOTA_17315 [Chitinophaga sp. GCM10012297]|uniref:Bulb-type lectin domain-containing protein n=1 Tax=Chitinophaga chungangae TaxID=2821488 RepID=A0ABS3YH29_9BACT|nr:hypothetical protein [Chitinophaga chungangae]MBO9153981.1 hypothetical protein [Chitinophaga chungangae]
MLRSNAQSSFRATRDSVVMNRLELAIRHNSQLQQGFLLNTGNGHTLFRGIGNAVQFAPGATGYPAVGANTYTNALFSGKYVKVWRNGRLQGENTTTGIQFDAATGKITFYPVLATSDRIYIEALHRSDFTQF